jgi:hypothetical protein
MKFDFTPARIMLELDRLRLMAFEKFWEENDNDLDDVTFC